MVTSNSLSWVPQKSVNFEVSGSSKFLLQITSVSWHQVALYDFSKYFGTWRNLTQLLVNIENLYMKIWIDTIFEQHQLKTIRRNALMTLVLKNLPTYLCQLSKHFLPSCWGKVWNYTTCHYQTLKPIEQIYT